MEVTSIDVTTLAAVGTGAEFRSEAGNGRATGDVADVNCGEAVVAISFGR